MKLFHTPRELGPVQEIDSSFVEHIFCGLELGEYGFLVLSGQGHLHSIDEFNNLPTNSVIIFDECTNPELISQSARSRLDLDQIKRPYYILTSNFNFKNYFPFWEIWTGQQAYSLSDKTKTHRVSCLMGTEWNHRKLMYLALSKQSWFDSMIFSYGNRQRYDDWDNQLTVQEKQEFEQLPNPQQWVQDDASHEIDLTVNHPAYQSAWVNLVVETSVNTQTPILSEKTFKPISVGQMFITFSAPGSIEYLRSRGYDVFDDIINHSYDDEIDVRKRCDMIVSELDRLVQLNLDSIGPTLEARFIKNRELLVKFGKENTCLIIKQVV